MARAKPRVGALLLPSPHVVDNIGINSCDKFVSAEVADKDDVARRVTTGHNKLLAIC